MNSKRMFPFALACLRIALGWLFFYAGITKVLNAEWSAAGYISNAQTFSAFYEWLASPGIIDVINFLNAWGLTLIGIALVLGLFTRIASYLGALLMLLYYLPILSFPYVGEHSYLVDEHIIYIFVLILFTHIKAGNYFGLDGLRKR